jgi:hypothetical protein
MFAGAEMMIDIFPVFALRHNGCRRVSVGVGNLLMHHGERCLSFLQGAERKIGELLKASSSFALSLKGTQVLKYFS